MAYKLNPKAEALTPYDPVTGSYQVRLDANESFILPDDALAEKLQAKLTEVLFNRYPDPLAQKLCECFAEYYGINPSAVTAGNGSDELIGLIMNAFLMKGDKVLTLAPDFSMYRFYAQLNECGCDVLEKRDDLTVDVERLKQMLSSGAYKMLIFSNPCNPTSLGINADDVRGIIRSTDALVVLDEAYMDFWDQSLLKEAEAYDNLIILRTCSKALGLAAMRIGFAVANPLLTKALKSAKSPYNVNSVNQAAAVILQDKDFLRSSLQCIKESKQNLLEGLKKVTANERDVTIFDSVTNFVFMHCDRAQELFDFLKTNGIIIRKMGDKLRITAGTQRENRLLLEAVSRFFNSEEGKA